jgi:hypothetical protein
MADPQVRFRQVDVDGETFPDLEAASAYWHRRRQETGRFAPSWRDIDLLALPARLIPRICVVDVMPEGPDFRYRFWGTGVTGLHSYDLTGRSVLDLVPAYYARCVWQQYRAVLDTRRPLGFLTEMPKPNGLLTYYAAIRMPLSGDGETIDRVMTAEDYGDEREPLRELFEEVWRQRESGAEP